MNRRAFVTGLGAAAPLGAEIHHEADALVQTPRRSALLTRRLWFARGKGYVKTRGDVPGLRELLLKRLLDDLFQPLRQLTPEQLSKERDVTRRVDRLRIDPHLHPKPDPLELDPLAVWGPLSPAYQGAELS